MAGVTGCVGMTLSEFGPVFIGLQSGLLIKRWPYPLLGGASKTLRSLSLNPAAGR